MTTRWAGVLIVMWVVGGCAAAPAVERRESDSKRIFAARLLNAGRYREAKLVLDEARRQAAAVDDLAGRAEACFDLAATALAEDGWPASAPVSGKSQHADTPTRRENLRQAAEWAQEVRWCYRAVGDAPNDVSLLSAKIARQRGRRDEAADFVRQAAGTKNRGLLAELQLTLALLALDSEDESAARGHADAAAASLKGIGGQAPADVAGLQYFVQGRLDSATTRPANSATGPSPFEKASQEFFRARRPRAAAWALTEAARHRRSAGDASKAAELFYRAALVFGESGLDAERNASLTDAKDAARQVKDPELTGLIDRELSKSTTKPEN